jgi:pseudouridylate synthase
LASKTSVGAPIISAEVAGALREGHAIVALESAVITHGLPHPINLEVALEVERAVAAHGATPATIGLLDGDLRVGLGVGEIQRMAESRSVQKIGVRDIAEAGMRGLSGGTTVAATMFAAHRAGIVVFATGGIGGVHREGVFDVSADLHTLANTPMVVVCAGAKAILDLPATLEVLESLSVPVIGYQTNEFPAFYSRQSGLRTSTRVESVEEVAAYWRQHRAVGMKSSVLMANPIPEPHAIPALEMNAWIDAANAAARAQDVRGKELTPFLLGRVAEMSGGRTLDANRALLVNNASLAAQIAVTVAQASK